MEFLVLIAAAIRAGVLNTVAGAGTFLTFPALVLAGIPPVVAWPQAVVMIQAATAGDYAATPLARALPKPVVRGQSQRWASE